MKLILIAVLIALFCGIFIYLQVIRVRKAQIRKQMLANKVLARVKEHRGSIWICKFFDCGDHVGFFSSQPHADRVEAVVVGYDQEKQMYELQEIKK